MLLRVLVLITLVESLYVRNEAQQMHESGTSASPLCTLHKCVPVISMIYRPSLRSHVKYETLASGKGAGNSKNIKSIVPSENFKNANWALKGEYQYNHMGYTAAYTVMNGHWNRKLTSSDGVAIPPWAKVGKLAGAGCYEEGTLGPRVNRGGSGNDGNDSDFPTFKLACVRKSTFAMDEAECKCWVENFPKKKNHQLDQRVEDHQLPPHVQNRIFLNELEITKIKAELEKLQAEV